MGSISLQQFQEQVGELLLRHRSLLDILSKYQQSNGAVNRSVVKAITECGCIEVNAGKQPYTADMTIEQARSVLGTHMKGQLCENCREAVNAEMGRNLFYLSALCNVLDLHLDYIVEEESTRCSTLGFFNLS